MFLVIRLHLLGMLKYYVVDINIILISTRVFDMFPQTAHVELVGVFEKGI